MTVPATPWGAYRESTARAGRDARGRETCTHRPFPAHDKHRDPRSVLARVEHLLGLEDGEVEAAYPRRPVKTRFQIDPKARNEGGLLQKARVPKILKPGSKSKTALEVLSDLGKILTGELGGANHFRRVAFFHVGDAIRGARLEETRELEKDLVLRALPGESHDGANRDGHVTDLGPVPEVPAGCANKQVRLECTHVLPR